MEVWYLFSVRYLRQGSLFKEGHKRHKSGFNSGQFLVFLLQLAFTYLPVLQHVCSRPKGLLLVHGVYPTVLIGIAVFYAGT